jgi:hypothetical protein
MEEDELLLALLSMFLSSLLRHISGYRLASAAQESVAA